MNKIAAIGEGYSVIGLRTIGVDTFETGNPEDAVKALYDFAHKDYAVVYITEPIAAQISNEIEKYAERLTPAIILIPGSNGENGAGLAGIKTAVERAVGADILGE